MFERCAGRNLKNLALKATFIVLKGDSNLIIALSLVPLADDAEFGKKVASAAVKSSFERVFNDKAGAVCSFLDYPSRHYGKQKFKLNEKFKYYSPIASMHQTSESGKSRLTEELTPFILPIMISGLDVTGRPSGSKLFAEFCDFL